MIRSDGNKIIFEGNLRTETRAALVCIFQLTQKLRYLDVILDSSGVKYVDADLMLPLSSYAAYYRMNQIDFSLVEPVDPKLRRLFTNTNWAHFMTHKNMLETNKDGQTIFQRFSFSMVTLSTTS
jgi:hypothetical protein